MNIEMNKEMNKEMNMNTQMIIKLSRVIKKIDDTSESTDGERCSVVTVGEKHKKVL